jgi:hypothetical protein
MASLKLTPVPQDSNSHRLVDRASQAIFDARTYGTAQVPFQFAVDIKGCAIQVVSGTLNVKTEVPTAWSAGKPMFTDKNNPTIDRKGPAKHFLDAAAAVDAGGGKVQIAAAYHGFASGDTVVIHGTTNYGTAAAPVTEVLTAGTSSSVIEFTATYVAENIPATAFITGSRAAQFTAGQTFDYPTAIEADVTAAQHAAASGTAVINILAWR